MQKKKIIGKKAKQYKFQHLTHIFLGEKLVLDEKGVFVKIKCLLNPSLLYVSDIISVIWIIMP